MTYEDFLKQKQINIEPSGFDVDKANLNQGLYDWQKDIVKWALKKGKCALFEDCGLGKTIQQLAWADQVATYTDSPVLILAPLAVSMQTKGEGAKFGINVNIAEANSDIKNGINITNYEKLDKFNPGKFAGVVLDESSILKNFTGKTRNQIIDMFRGTKYKLACTATPAPNDFMELGSHSEFLGIMTHNEMLSTFFVHDGGDTSKWKLKGHAETKYWEWIANWACVMQTPADLGYEVDGYNLPQLKIIERSVESRNMVDSSGQCLLVSNTSQNLNERRQYRRDSLEDRVKESSDIANSIDGQVLIWCDLNTESEALSKSITGAVEVKGSDTSEHKAKAMLGFSDGSVRCLVSKPSICGWGMNWQNCSNMIFVGLSDSFEAYYQAVRRCWRFGQKKPVNVYIIISEAEGAVRINIQRKQENAEKAIRELSKYTRDILSADIRNTTRITKTYYAHEEMIIPQWIM